MNQKQKKESIERMGSMMLQGWRMLAECCPICTSPLMSKGDNMRCPGCDMPIKFMTEDEEEALLSKQASNQSLKDRMPLSEQSEVSLIADSKVSTPAAFVDEQITVDSINSFEEMKRDYDLKNASRAKTTTKLGEYMLQGWTLLGDLCLLNSCVGTPLMEHDGYILCVSCNAEYLRCPDGEIVDKKAASLSPHNSTDKTSPLDSASKSSSRQEDDFVDDGLPILNFHRNEEASDNDVSSKIAAKLMRGWALLDEACPLDNVPLMRDKNGKVSCI